ncbi:MAG: hypothetical protein ACRDWW_08260 [Acidimicrobiales bacterium]
MAAQGAPGARLQRLHHRRRLVREELLAVAVLVLALAVTLLILGLQWLGGSPPAAGSAPAAGATFGGIV